MGTLEKRMFSDRDHYGVFAHRKVVNLTDFRARRRRRFLFLLAAVCVLGFLAPFAVTFVHERLGSVQGFVGRYSRPVGMRPAAGQLSPGPIPICSGRARFSATCLVDGDTGWERGIKWRLRDVDTPEVSNPGCPAELRHGLAARDRLQSLMSYGYRLDRLGAVDRYGRQLVRITLPGGRDAGRVLLAEGLAQPWPNIGNVWCGR